MMQWIHSPFFPPIFFGFFFFFSHLSNCLETVSHLKADKAEVLQNCYCCGTLHAVRSSGVSNTYHGCLSCRERLLKKFSLLPSCKCIPSPLATESVILTSTVQGLSAEQAVWFDHKNSSSVVKIRLSLHPLRSEVLCWVFETLESLVTPCLCTPCKSFLDIKQQHSKTYGEQKQECLNAICVWCITHTQRGSIAITTASVQNNAPTIANSLGRILFLQ